MKLAELLAPFVKAFLTIFFDKKYLSGKHFNGNFGGYKWAINAAWSRNILRLGQKYPWPVHLNCYVSNPNNIFFHPDDLNNFQSRGAYFQCFAGKIYIGSGSYVGPNVGLITSNHDPANPDKHLPPQDIYIGEKCWLGMNSIILPGVMLGPNTVVAAGSVVTKSFESGKVVIGGVPAKIIKNIP